MKQQEPPKSKQLSVWAGTMALIRYRPGIFLVAFIFEVYFIGTRTVTGLIVQRVFDTLTGEAPAVISLWSLLALLLAVEGTRMVANITGVWGASRFRNVMAALMRKNVIVNSLGRHGAVPPPVSPGDAITRLDDDVADFADFPTWLSELFGHGIFAIIALVIMLQINWQITLVAVLPLLGIIFLNRYAWQRFLYYNRLSRSTDSAATSFLGDVLGGVQAVKVADAEGNVMHYFSQLNETRRRANVNNALFWTFFQTISANLGDIAVGIMVLLVREAMQAGTFTIGDFSLFTTYLFFIARFPATIGSYTSEIAQQRVGLDRLQAMQPEVEPASLVAHGPLYEKEDAPQVSLPQKTAADVLQTLSVQGLHYRYPGSEAVALEGIDLTLSQGEFVVVTGRIGAGKTTLLRTLLGLLPWQGGEIRWNGKLVTDPATFFVPPRSAYTPQVPRLFSEPLRDNILMGLSSDRVDLPGAIETAVLAEDIARLEKGLDTVVGPRGVRLSGGQIQRTAATRMFVREASLLVVDDLSSALDVETEQLLWQRLRQRYQASFLVVSHRRPVLRMADRIVVLANGRVVAEGQLEGLLTTSAEMQHLWQGHQNGREPQ